MAAVRKKQDDSILKSLRELAALPANKLCFDCSEKGVTYVNMTIGSFVCTSCSGILRGLTPPHRVKSISMATFTEDDVEFLRSHGNEECAKTWLGLWDSKRALKMDHKDFMTEKYERKRFYLEPASPLKSIPSTTKQSTTTNSRPVVVQLPVSKQNGHHVAATKQQQQHKTTSNFQDAFTIEDPSSLFNKCKPPQKNHHQNGNSQEFVADFSKADLFAGQNGSHSKVNGNSHTSNNGVMRNGSGGGGTIENFADFEHNQIYNAADNSKGSPRNGFVKTNNNTIVNNNKTNAPSADRYAALAELDEQIREIKIIGGKPETVTNNNGTANPFKSNPFQAAPAAATSPWGVESTPIPTSKPATNGWSSSNGFGQFNTNFSTSNSLFGSPTATNGFTMSPYGTTGLVPQQQTQHTGFGTSTFGGLNQPNGNYNPFMTGTVNSNNPFL